MSSHLYGIVFYGVKIGDFDYIPSFYDEELGEDVEECFTTLFPDTEFSIKFIGHCEYPTYYLVFKKSIQEGQDAYMYDLEENINSNNLNKFIKENTIYTEGHIGWVLGAYIR